MNLIQRDKNVVWHPFTQMQTADSPIPIKKGKGALLYDYTDKVFIDGISSWWVNTHGHSHPYIAQKVFEQMNTLEHVIFGGCTHEGAVRLVERILEKMPKKITKGFFSDNGSTSVEVAIKMVFQYWYNKGQSKTKFIAFKGSYHGDTFGAMSVSGRSAFSAPFEPMLFDVLYIDVPTHGQEEKTYRQLKNILHTYDDIAGFICEPLVLGSGGMIMYTPSILNKLIMLCQENNTLVIADEVMTGFGRTGRFFAIDYLDKKPDLVCLSKGITGGTMALGMTVCTEQIYQAFLSEDKMKTFFHGHSYTANPVACAAALASMDLMEQSDTWANIKRITEKNCFFAQSIARHSAVKDVRYRGTILAIEINDQTEQSSYFSNIRDTLYHFFLKRNILLRPLGNVVYFMPPYCITDEQIYQVQEAIRALLNYINSNAR